jgi:hypothetical protein
MRPGRAGNFDDVLAFPGADGTMIPVALNRQNGPQKLAIKLGTANIEMTLPARSFICFQADQATWQAALKS